MSPHGINSLVGDLVEMAKATERLPQLETELAEANRRLNDREAHNAALEGNIIRYKEEIETLHAKVRSLEVERDDASFRVLEAEDREHGALTLLRSAQTYLGTVIANLDPPKPEPVKEPEQSKFDDGGPYNEPHPTASTAEPPTSSAPNASEPSVPNTVHSIQEQGQSESHPTTALVSSPTQENAPTPTTSTDVRNSESATSPEASHGPYYGKRYHDMSYYIPLSDWLAGGGTEEDYHWRPASRHGY